MDRLTALDTLLSNQSLRSKVQIRPQTTCTVTFHGRAGSESQSDCTTAAHIWRPDEPAHQPMAWGALGCAHAAGDECVRRAGEAAVFFFHLAFQLWHRALAYSNDALTCLILPSCALQLKVCKRTTQFTVVALGLIEAAPPLPKRLQCSQQ